MLKRFDKAVIAAKPDLGVVAARHQFGAAQPRSSTGRPRRQSRAGLAKIRAIGADVVLIDPQFAPKVIVKPEAEHMVAFIASDRQAGRRRPCSARYDVMKRWRDARSHGVRELRLAPTGCT